jgi:hypothetical protein
VKILKAAFAEINTEHREKTTLEMDKFVRFSGKFIVIFSFRLAIYQDT